MATPNKTRRLTMGPEDKLVLLVQENLRRNAVHMVRDQVLQACPTLVGRLLVLPAETVMDMLVVTDEITTLQTSPSPDTASLDTD